MSRIPYPFKIKRKHDFPPLSVHRFKVHRSGLPCPKVSGSLDIYTYSKLSSLKKMLKTVLTQNL
jgi:hypothetical protein